MDQFAPSIDTAVLCGHVKRFVMKTIMWHPTEIELYYVGFYIDRDCVAANEDSEALVVDLACKKILRLQFLRLSRAPGLPAVQEAFSKALLQNYNDDKAAEKAEAFVNKLITKDVLSKEGDVLDVTIDGGKISFEYRSKGYGTHSIPDESAGVDVNAIVNEPEFVRAFQMMFFTETIQSNFPVELSKGCPGLKLPSPEPPYKSRVKRRTRLMEGDADVPAELTICGKVHRKVEHVVEYDAIFSINEECAREEMRKHNAGETVGSLTIPGLLCDKIFTLEMTVELWTVTLKGVRKGFSDHLKVDAAFDDAKQKFINAMLPAAWNKGETLVVKLLKDGVTIDAKWGDKASGTKKAVLINKVAFIQNKDIWIGFQQMYFGPGPIEKTFPELLRKNCEFLPAVVRRSRLMEDDSYDGGRQLYGDGDVMVKSLSGGSCASPTNVAILIIAIIIAFAAGYFTRKLALFSGAPAKGSMTAAEKAKATKAGGK